MDGLCSSAKLRKNITDLSTLYSHLTLQFKRIFSTLDCDDGYSFHSSTSTCFIVPSQAASWTSAQAVCLKMGGTLAKVDSHAKLQFIRSITRNVLYVGLKQVMVVLSSMKGEKKISPLY